MYQSNIKTYLISIFRDKLKITFRCLCSKNRWNVRGLLKQQWKLTAELLNWIWLNSSFSAWTFEQNFKGTAFLPQTQIFESLYLNNLMVWIFDISHLDYLILHNLWNIKICDTGLKRKRDWTIRVCGKNSIP